MFRLFYCSLLFLTTFASVGSEIDVLKGLVAHSTVEVSLRTNMVASFGDSAAEKASVVDRIGLSNLFLVSIDNKPYVSDATGTFISSQSDLKRFTSMGLFNAMTTNKGNEDNIKFYEYAKTQQDSLPVFRGVGEQAGLIVAFMDPSCPNCKKFHLSQRLKVNSMGYDVMYIPSARNPRNEKLVNALVHFYCRKEGLMDSVQTLYNDFKRASSKQKALASCSSQQESYIRHMSEVFSRHRMVGSPSFITPEGMTLYGYGELERYIDRKGK